MEIRDDMTLVRNKNLITSQMDGETVMMSIEDGKYFGLNTIGSRIWDLLENPITVNAMCDQLMNEFSVSEEECRKDVMDFLNELKEENLLEEKK